MCSLVISPTHSLFFSNRKNIYLFFERERERQQAEEVERDRGRDTDRNRETERESQAGCALSMQSPTRAQSHKLQIMI